MIIFVKKARFELTLWERLQFLSMPVEGDSSFQTIIQRRVGILAGHTVCLVLIYNISIVIVVVMVVLE